MSKLVEKLNQVGKPAPHPFGFGLKATPAAKASAMVLIVSLPRNDIELAKAAIDNGADALKVQVDIEDHTSGNSFGPFDQERSQLEAIIAAAKNIPVGILLGGTSLQPEMVAETLAKVAELKFDFVSVYPHHAPAAFLSSTMEKIGRSLIIDNSYTDIVIRSLNIMPCDMIEADILPAESDGLPLTVQDIMQYAKISMLVQKPLLVPSQHVITPGDLAILQEIGVEGITIGPVLTGDSAKSLAAATTTYRKAIDQLKPVRNRRERETVLLPLPSERPSMAAEPDQEPE